MIEIEKMVETLKLLSDKTRLTILLLLKERELCVFELVDILQTSQPNVSQHIRKLKDGGLVKEAKKGQWVYYSLTIEINRSYPIYSISFHLRKKRLGSHIL